MKSARNWGRLGMKSEWYVSTIDDVCLLVTDGAHNSPPSVENGEYMASVKDFAEYGFDFSTCKRISSEDYSKLEKQGCVPNIGDVLVGKDGARYFEDIVIYKQPERPALLSSIAILRVNPEIITSEFLYYTLKSPAVKKDVRDNYGSGSAIPRIVLKDFKRILKSPVRRIHKVKTASNIKETYSDETLELMRDSCSEMRDLAMIDLLASTGMRVGEMVLLNRDDVDFAERECVVFGKGDKERMVYFDARTKLHLQAYLNSRNDNNPALIVSLKAPFNRLSIGGVETRLRELGRQLGVHKVHPHKFRRTLATMAIDKGMPIEQLQQLLGHKRIDTTLQYAMVKQSNVKLAHRKYIG